MADAALVPQPVLDQLHQPFVVHRIIEAPNVGSEYPGAVAFLHAYRDGIQRMVRAASRTGTVREAEPRWLVHGVEHLDRRPLNDLVFQRRLAAGPLAPISLGAVDRLDRGRLVRSPLEPVRPVPPVGVELLAVGGPWLAIQARCCLVLEAVVGLPQAVDGVDMMPQRRQPFPPLLRGLAYPVQRT
jgi:hypothetical protein